MKFKRLITNFMLLTIASIFIFAPQAYSRSSVKFSCSAQIAEAFGKDVVKLLKDKTGLELDLVIVSSNTALNRLENGFSEIAAITIPLPFEKQESGYVAIPFCKDPMSIIARNNTKVNNISSSDVANIFTGGIENWKDIGGDDIEITKVVPCAETGSYVNFEKLFMGLNSIKYDFMTYCSVTTLSGVQAIDGAISFISHGAAVKAKGIKILKVDGISPDSKNYKFYQTFTLVTKGIPKAGAKELIDIAFSEKAQAVMKEKGMFPIIP